MRRPVTAQDFKGETRADICACVHVLSDPRTTQSTKNCERCARRVARTRARKHTSQVPRRTGRGARVAELLKRRPEATARADFWAFRTHGRGGVAQVLPIWARCGPNSAKFGANIGNFSQRTRPKSVQIFSETARCRATNLAHASEAPGSHAWQSFSSIGLASPQLARGALCGAGHFGDYLAGICSGLPPRARHVCFDIMCTPFCSVSVPR